uniref:Phosphopantetheinyltransferase n=1 Tax=uncultured bacterial symbiont of Discodermia dissoluta TaxID=323654 RepID=Q49HI6_9BACT|nr:phosphopantetheinyltransferase [uncultured bacterial symbiont of Discodermia dissoluta]
MLTSDSTVSTIKLLRANWSGTAYFSWSITDEYPRLDQNHTLILHPEECLRYASMKFERRRTSFLLGRYAAKKALSSYFDESDLSTIAVLSGVFGQPVVHYLSSSCPIVTISHASQAACAIASPDVHPMGLDLESIDAAKSEAIKSQMTSDELGFLLGSTASDITGLTMMWSAKEALSKILMCGLMCPFELLAIRSLSQNEAYYEGEYLNFHQYKFQSWVMEAAVCTIAFPRRTQIEIDMTLFLEALT